MINISLGYNIIHIPFDKNISWSQESSYFKNLLLVALASCNSNMVAPYKQYSDGGWTIYCTKKLLKQDKEAFKRDVSFFDQFSDDSFTIGNISLTTSASNISTSTKTLYANIVTGIDHVPSPTVKAKVESSDDGSVCSSISQNSLTLITCKVSS